MEVASKDPEESRAGEKRGRRLADPSKYCFESQKKIDTLQTQAASLMRLNAVWGLESKGPTIDRYKATVTAEEAD